MLSCVRIVQAGTNPCHGMRRGCTLCRSSCGRLLRNRSILHRDGPLPVSWQEDPVLAPNVSGIAISGTGTTHSLFAFCGVPFSAAFGFGGQRGTVRDAADDFWGCGPPTMP